MNHKSHPRKFCDCGQPATTIHNNARICDRCYRIESEQSKREKKREERPGIHEQADVFKVCGLSF